ncbi:type II secretion system F family protein [Amycolatopsis suaedae]|uniref:Type II secretion system protein n=1 Tax=Amycolatopsis suaedae TaxID=2510978 RepID=A0A4Q7J4I2_9PSEU|nr:type II secretion system F family protein [Amycolatopsis suaedae]RZQ61606.1 type II secretion system protein [Amycolatopsis suaedae]
MTADVATLALLAGALLVWPPGPVRPPRSVLRPEPAGRLARLRSAPWSRPAALAIGLAALGAAVLGWPAGAVAAVPLGLLGWLAGRRLRTGSDPPDPASLAVGWDLLAAALRAGLPVPVAVRAVADAVPARPADALRATAELLALGADAERAWQPAMACPETVVLAKAARRAASSGTALAAVARDLACRVRTERADTAEAKAQRAGVLVTVPLGLCFLPAFLCLGVVPVVVGLAGRLTAIT